MQKGSIRVQTENIFPIIKKFLYSDQDIFIRELVSNAVDATQKLKTLSNLGKTTSELGDLKVKVTVDKDAKTITISDNGIGMTAEEVDKYINQVAFSGAEEFLEKYKGQNEANIIGHFGLGFYSAFMVSKKVEIITKSHTDAPAVHWVCDGSPEFTIEEHSKTERGTDIILHLNEESEEYADEFKIKSIIKKFGKFLAIPVFFGDDQINNPNPIWVKKPSELTDEDYLNFYKELYPFSEPPLFWIHLNVDYPFNLTGVLYFPKIKSTVELQRDKIQLYCNQVFVTDEVKEIVPEFLTLLHGVIDSPDIPLNVSRSYLQGDPNVKKINNHITKKVADKLEEIFNKDRKSFEEKWESIGLFVKYGMMTDDKFFEKAENFLLLQDVADDKFYSYKEWKQKVEPVQKNKDEKIILVYATNKQVQDKFIKGAQQLNISVIKFEDALIDQAFVSNIEIKWNDVQFVRVDSAPASQLIEKADNASSVLTEEQTNTLKELFNLQYKGIVLQIEVAGLSENEQPLIATQNEMMRRMKEMATNGAGGLGSFYGNMPNEILLTVNGNHKIYQSILALEDKELQSKKIQQLADLALLNLGLLTGEERSKFIERSFEMI